MALRVMIFTTFLGLKVTDVKAVAKAVLPRFYLEDLHENAYKAFSSCRGKKAEDPLKNCLGLVAAPAVVARVQQYEAIRATLGDGNMIDVGIADTALTSHPYVLLCKLQEVYFVPVEEKAPSLPRKDYSKPLIFHDGRAVVRPTPLNALAVLLWVPMGVILAITRLSVGKLLPYKLGLMAAAATGLKIRAKLPPPSRPNNQTCNTLYVCSHRTLIDPVIVASALQRHVTAVTYSVSRVSELLSPIRTVRLRRDRADDGATMRGLLMQGDLVVCPEGTTCREPYLLRFSPLFAEIADVIVPVDVSANATMFHGTTVRGYKWLDSFFFLMNPNPHYHLQFLDKVAGVRTCESLGKSSYDIANQVQQMIGRALGFQCTNFTRRDKYRTLAGNDGVGKAKEVVESNTPHVCSI
ncbi:PREDICTED: glycerol-3-phosphate acyltransferase 1-like [Nelumbo nucifera]|uniref:Glycerol-3-phosphate acyltransferase 1-like n=1 Tax=Nelumbo nucifera TaxID=4432 RepID=A0A1U8BF84_NELNU|nr:PREDICTED: glycerol-3-phosphate acyltransferase 1-like [Nelumbo nucifera]